MGIQWANQLRMWADRRRLDWTFFYKAYKAPLVPTKTTPWSTMETKGTRAQQASITVTNPTPPFTTLTTPQHISTAVLKTPRQHTGTLLLAHRACFRTVAVLALNPMVNSSALIRPSLFCRAEVGCGRSGQTTRGENASFCPRWAFWDAF